jgi:hypothetical protein
MSVRDQLLDDLCAAISKESRDDEATVANARKLRNVLADWFEDNNHRDEAECLRWMIENQKRPYHGSNPQASWFNADTVSAGLGDPESDIPGPLYQHLEGGKVTANHQTFDTIKAAEEAFIAAFVKAVKGGWKPAGAPKAEEPPAEPTEAKPKKKKGK